MPGQGVSRPLHVKCERCGETYYRLDWPGHLCNLKGGELVTDNNAKDLDIAGIENRLKHISPGWVFDFTEGDWGGIIRDSEDDNRTVATIEMEKLGYQFRWDGEFIANAPNDIAALITGVKRLKGEVRWGTLLEAANLCCTYCASNIPLRRITDSKISSTGYVHVVRHEYQPECYAGLIHQAIAAEVDQGQGIVS